jgi:hypothetical protein
MLRSALLTPCATRVKHASGALCIAFVTQMSLIGSVHHVYNICVWLLGMLPRQHVSYASDVRFTIFNDCPTPERFAVIIVWDLNSAMDLLTRYRIPWRIRVKIVNVHGPALNWSPCQIRKKLGAEGYHFLPSAQAISNFIHFFHQGAFDESVFGESRLSRFQQAFQLHVFHTVIRCKEYRMSPN